MPQWATRWKMLKVLVEVAGFGITTGFVVAVIGFA